MNLRHIVLVAALAFTSPAAAASIVYNGNNNGASVSETFSNLLGNYKLDASLFSFFFPGFGAGAASVELYSISDSASVLTLNLSTFSNDLFDSKVANLFLDGDYKLTISGFSFNGFTGADASLSAVAVPGPEAGAGLAGLAMAGLGFYLVRRRRQEDATAA